MSRSTLDAKVNNEDERGRKWYENIMLPATPEVCRPSHSMLESEFNRGKGRNRKWDERKKRCGQRHSRVRSHGLLDLLS